jgi:hypothetical protein
MKPERDDVVTGILVGISIIIGIFILSFALQMFVMYG